MTSQLSWCFAHLWKIPKLGHQLNWGQGFFFCYPVGTQLKKNKHLQSKWIKSYHPPQVGVLKHWKFHLLLTWHVTFILSLPFWFHVLASRLMYKNIFKRPKDRPARTTLIASGRRTSMEPENVRIFGKRKSFWTHQSLGSRVRFQGITKNIDILWYTCCSCINKYKWKKYNIYVQYECVCLYLCWFKPFIDVLVENYHLLLHVCKKKKRRAPRMAWVVLSPGLPGSPLGYRMTYVVKVYTPRKLTSPKTGPLEPKKKLGYFPWNTSCFFMAIRIMIYDWFMTSLSSIIPYIPWTNRVSFIAHFNRKPDRLPTTIFQGTFVRFRIKISPNAFLK